MFKYVPAIVNKENFSYYYKESRWGWTLYTSKYKIVKNYKKILVDKGTHKKIETFTKPIDMRKYNLLRSEIEHEFLGRLKPSNIMSKNRDLNISVSKEYEIEYERVKKEWKNRMDASAGNFHFQYNVKLGLFGDGYMRMIQAGLNVADGDKPEMSYVKTNWFRYFFVDTPVSFVIHLYCKLNNFYYRKEIAEEEEVAKKERQRLWDESCMILDVKERVDNEQRNKE